MPHIQTGLHLNNPLIMAKNKAAAKTETTDPVLTERESRIAALQADAEASGRVLSWAAAAVVVDREARRGKVADNGGGVTEGTGDSAE